MNEVSPNYYASGELPETSTLRGENLDIIPVDAIGVLSSENENPLELRYTQSDYNTASIVSISEDEIELRFNGESSHLANVYLGAIVSQDREVVYWMNETSPLP